ncbi:hypothetical protein DFH09DRAFT_1356857 [Mycena vulgaris]|nr:hypothetical protein DFH09DRAFT_1356857 [Mycena vulgaris]
MSFIANADHVTLGDGVYSNSGNLNIVNDHIYGRKRHREEITDTPELSSIEPLPKRRRHDGIKVLRNKYLKLKLEIGSGPGYLLHAGEAKGRAVIVKVFDEGPTVLQQLESTVALSKGLMHPNVLRIEGVSSSASLSHFIAYENAYWKTAEGPLAAALKENLAKSVTLGFKMIAGLSSGMNYLSVQGISLGVENFDIFLDVDDRFLISINPTTSPEGYVADHEQSEENTNKPWAVFNALCQKVLRSANRVLHDEGIERNPVVLDLGHRNSVRQKSLESSSIAAPLSFDSDVEVDETPSIPVPPRREYIWRTIDCGQQSLANVASRISRDLDKSSIRKLTWSDVQSAHRCSGYVREEITLATTMDDSAVVSHDAPSPFEVCCICHEVVGVHEVFWCICGDPRPGSRNTVKCQACSPVKSKTVTEIAEPVPATPGDTSQRSTSRDSGEGTTRPSPARDISPVSDTSRASEPDDEVQSFDELIGDDVVPPLVVPPVVPTSSAAGSSSIRKAPSKRNPRKSEKEIAEESA